MSLTEQNTKLFDQAQELAGRWFDVAETNTRALFDLARTSTGVRTLDQAKLFAADAAKVTRENFERFTVAAQQTAQEQAAQWTQTIQEAGEQVRAVAEGKTKASKR